MIWCYDLGVLLPVDALGCVWVLLRILSRMLLRAYGTAEVAGYDYVKIVLSFCHFAFYAK